jgi:hypothetical protein
LWSSNTGRNRRLPSSLFTPKHLDFVSKRRIAVVLSLIANLAVILYAVLHGLNFGVDPKSLSIKLPIVGRLGPKNQPEPTNIPAAGS